MLNQRLVQQQFDGRSTRISCRHEITLGHVSPFVKIQFLLSRSFLLYKTVMFLTLYLS